MKNVFEYIEYCFKIFKYTIMPKNNHLELSYLTIYNMLCVVSCRFNDCDAINET